VPVSPFVRPTDAKGASSGGRRGSPIEIIVVGGETNPYWVAGDFGYVGSASVDKWR
jgi:hypothetical protein